MKEFLALIAKRFFVDVPPYVTMPIFILWFLAVCALIFGGSTVFELYWFRVGTIFVVMISALAVFFWPHQE